MRASLEPLGMKTAEGVASSSAPGLRSFLFSLVALYYILPLLLWLGVIPFAWRFQLLACMTVAMVVYDRWCGFGFKELGFRRDTLRESLFLNVIASLLLIIFMLVSFKLGLIRSPTIPAWRMFFVYYLVISSTSQEFLFRSSLFALMNRAHISGPMVQILVSAATYSFLHIFYKDLITLVATFLIGLLWGWTYYKYPNFWGVAFSHALLGATSIKIGLL